MPRGLPAPELPDADLVGDHLAVIGIASVALLLIGFSQTAGDARAFATRHHYRIDVNQESVAQGMANVGAGRVPGDAGLDEPLGELAERVGGGPHAASRRSSTGGLVLATLIVLAPLFSDLPKAVLGAIIIDAVVFGMIDVPELRRLYRVTRFDFWIAVAAILGVLSAGVLAGVVIGVVLSLGWLVYVATQPPMPLLGREAGTQVFRDLVDHPDDETFPGHRGPAARRRPLLRNRRGARRSHPRAGGRQPSRLPRSCSTSRASTSSTRRARRSSPSSSSSRARGTTFASPA